MPWKESSKEMKREEFVNRVLAKEKSKSALCREYGISRPTGDKWIARFENGESLEDQSRAPFHTRNKTAPEMETVILEQRQTYPALGAVKTRRMLVNQGVTDLPCTSTINAIFKRNNCITPQASAAATPYQRFEKAFPNEMWQADFKGHFPMNDGIRCHPLNVLDDHSRFSLCVDALLNETFFAVKPRFERLFQTYGMPDSLLCDNGNPWGTSQSTGFTTFEVWLMELGVLVLHGRPRHPQTQGKEERFNRSFTREFLQFATFENQADAQRQFELYRQFYNNERPHFALNLDTPAQHYTNSLRVMPKTIEPWEYPSGYQQRIIKKSGYLTVGGQGYFLSEAFGNKTIAFRESHEPDCISLFFRQFKIGKINIAKRAFVFKRAFFIENDPRGLSKK